MWCLDDGSVACVTSVGRASQVRAKARHAIVETTHPEALIFKGPVCLGYGMGWSESAIMSSSEASSMFWSSFCRKKEELRLLLEMERLY